MWLIIGIVIGVAILGLVQWVRNKDVSVRWYEWLIVIIGLGLLLFTIQNFFASLAEDESQAAYMFLLATGLPSLILPAIIWQLVIRRQKFG